MVYMCFNKIYINIIYNLKYKMLLKIDMNVGKRLIVRRKIPMKQIVISTNV